MAIYDVASNMYEAVAVGAVREWCDSLGTQGRTNMLTALNNAHQYPEAGAYPRPLLSST
jgi:hypothetical protein